MIRRFFSWIFSLIKSIFMNGLLVILPITLTGLLFAASFKLVKTWLTPVHEFLPEILRDVPHAEFFLVIAFVFVVGFIAHALVLKPIIHFVEQSIFYKIPLISPVYSGIKQLVHALTSQDKPSLNTVVMFEFPRAGIYSIGFLTGEVSPRLAPDKSAEFASIFVPTTPNPTTGFFVLVHKRDFKIIDLTRQEAMALIISGGIVRPERFG